jgi:alkanesulfonate monooxygenase SsuD/methylene tetrahydromethanopterin reductase-like flavin-dependent oxidoreductase (luciferase family)
MLFDTLRRIAAHLFHSTNAAPASDTLAQRASALEFDPMWHGDHWQNLLSSPMDARHYVIEDWSLTPGLEFAPAVADGKHQ